MPQNNADNGTNLSPNGIKSGKTCNTGNKLAEIGKATQFKKGDPRINRNGRPRTFDQARALAQAISHELEVNKDGNAMTVAESVLRSWAHSPEPQLQKAFIEYAFGKVPDKIDATMEHRSKLYLNYSHEESNARKDHSRLSPSVPQSAN